MPDESWDLFFNQLFQSYLRTAASISAGVPTTAQMPIRISQDKDELARPYVLIKHDRRPETSTQVYDALVTIEGHFLDDDTHGTAAEQGEAWLQKIRQRLADRDALLAYIATLTTEVQTGWQPTVLHVIPLPFKRDREEEKGHLTLSFDLVWTCVVAAP